MSANLSLIVNDVAGVLRITSRNIAEARGWEHKNVLQVIDRLIENKPELGGLDFQPSEYLTSQGKSVREVLCSEKGALLVGMNMGGKDGTEFQIQVIDAFTAMRDTLHKLQVPAPTDVAALLRLAAGEIEQERHLRLVAEKTKSWIGDKKTATALARVGHANTKVHALTEELNHKTVELDVAKQEIADITSQGDWRIASVWASTYPELASLATNALGRKLNAKSKELGIETRFYAHIGDYGANAYHKQAVDALLASLTIPAGE